MLRWDRPQEDRSEGKVQGERSGHSPPRPFGVKRREAEDLRTGLAATLIAGKALALDEVAEASS